MKDPALPNVVEMPVARPSVESELARVLSARVMADREVWIRAWKLRAIREDLVSLHEYDHGETRLLIGEREVAIFLMRYQGDCTVACRANFPGGDLRQWVVTADGEDAPPPKAA